MTEETYGFDTARIRLEEIAAQVRKKDVSLEKSLDMLEEGVRLANLCTEQIDQAQWRSVIEETGPAADAEAPEGEPEGAGALPAEDDVPSEDSHGAAEEPPAEDPDVED